MPRETTQITPKSYGSSHLFLYSPRVTLDWLNLATLLISQSSSDSSQHHDQHLINDNRLRFNCSGFSAFLGWIWRPGVPPFGGIQRDPGRDRPTNTKCWRSSEAISWKPVARFIKIDAILDLSRSLLWSMRSKPCSFCSWSQVSASSPFILSQKSHSIWADHLQCLAWHVLFN